MINIALCIKGPDRLALLAGLLAIQPGFAVTVKTADSDDFLHKLSYHHMPDVAILDNAVAPVPAMTIVQYFKSWEHRTRSVLILDHYTPMDVMQALRANAGTLLEQDASPKDIIKAVQMAAAGKTFIGLREIPWLQRAIGNRLGKNLLITWKRRYTKAATLYDKLLAKGFKKTDIHSALHKLMMAEIEAGKKEAALNETAKQGGRK